jgi:hypothetical protein
MAANVTAFGGDPDPGAAGMFVDRALAVHERRRRDDDPVVPTVGSRE